MCNQQLVFVCKIVYVRTNNVVILFQYSSSRKFSLDFMITCIENFLMERKYFGFRIKAIELISANIRSLYIENFGA